MKKVQTPMPVPSLQFYIQVLVNPHRKNRKIESEIPIKVQRLLAKGIKTRFPIVIVSNIPIKLKVNILFHLV